jgi:quercetin dioxygenase-like cupin family protein
MNPIRPVLITLAALPLLAYAGSSSGIEVSRATPGEGVVGPAQNFTGTARLHSVFRRESPSRLSGALVTFDPGARTRWHTHPIGQTLVVTRGTGHVQHWGGKRETIREGDIVWIPPGVKHWHGAAASSSMSHVALVETLDGKTVDWLEFVSDEQYMGE